MESSTELDDLSDILNKMNLFHPKLKELIRERDALKSSLEEANNKIVELEASIAIYKAKDLVIETERHIVSQIINKLHQELGKEGPISKKINKVEEHVSGLSKAVEKLSSDSNCELDKKNSSVQDVYNSTGKAKRCEEEFRVNNDKNSFIKSDEYENQLVCVEDDIDFHIIEVILSDDEFPSEHHDEASKTSVFQQTLKHKSRSLGNSTVNNSDNCKILLTDVLASSSQLSAIRNEENEKSCSFSNEEISSSTNAKSSKSASLKISKEKPVKNENCFTDVGNAIFNSVDSCSGSRRSSPQTSLKPQISTRVKTTRKLGRPRVMRKKNNPNNPAPRFTDPVDFYHRVSKNHPKPHPITYLCPYGERNCRSYFRSMDHLRSHVKLSHQNEKLQLYPCNFSDEVFKGVLELKDHTEQKHVSPKHVKTSIICENCEYVAFSSETMHTHKLKRHSKRTSFGIYEDSKKLPVPKKVPATPTLVACEKSGVCSGNSLA